MDAMGFHRSNNLKEDEKLNQGRGVGLKDDKDSFASDADWEDELDCPGLIKRNFENRELQSDSA